MAPMGFIVPSRHAGWFRSAIRELYHYGRTDPGAAGITGAPLPYRNSRPKNERRISGADVSAGAAGAVSSGASAGVDVVAGSTLWVSRSGALWRAVSSGFGASICASRV